MECPVCHKTLKFDKSTSSWVCDDCKYSLTEKEFLDDYVFWFCDGCGTYMNVQEGFDRKGKRWICTECGFDNDITDGNIKGECKDCGKLLDNPDADLCEDCKILRIKKAQIILEGTSDICNTLSDVLDDPGEDDDSTEYITPEDCLCDLDNNEGETTEEFACAECGNIWVATPDKDGLYNGRGVPACPECGKLGYHSNNYADYTCQYCGHEWRQYGNGGLVLGCTPRCPKCKN